MAATLTGIVLGMREVEGVVKEGPRKGETWKFLSMEINDTRFGHAWSCQLRHDDPQYDQVLGSDLAGHKVKVTIKAQSAGPRELADGRKLMQIRSQVTNVRDLGVLSDDEE
jgi:hypothetical protein